MVRIRKNIKRIATIFRVSRELYGALGWRLAALFSLGFFEGVFGAVSITALIPLFAAVTGQSAAETAGISRALAAAFSALSIPFTVPSLLILLIALFAANAAFLFIFKYVGFRIFAAYETGLRTELYKRFLFARWPYLLRQKIGHLEHALMVHVRGVGHLLSLCMTSTHNLINVSIYAATAFFLAPRIALAALGTGAALLFLYRPFLRRMARYSRLQAEVSRAVAHELNENMTGLKVIKALRAEGAFLREGARLFGVLHDIGLRGALIRTFTTTLIPPVSVAFIAGVFWVMHQRPGFDLGVFLATLYVIQQIFLHVDKVQSALYGMNVQIPHAEYILRLSREGSAFEEKKSAAAPFAFSRSLSFENVSFSYGDQPALSSVSFEISKGETIGIVGSSGAGKTTIVDLMLRLFPPAEGSILLDGIPAESVSLDQWRTRIGYASQDLFLKNVSIEENIVFFQDGLSDEDVRKAAEQAHIRDFIEALPQGFASQVGDRGVLLSAGQRQRVVLARVLARAPDILILDEATSALDNESERAIRRTLELLRGAVTIIIIAHRLSSVTDCDRVIVVEHGRIMEEGSPKTLLALPDSRFSALHRAGA